jgi:hypothetical protein
MRSLNGPRDSSHFRIRMNDEIIDREAQVKQGIPEVTGRSSKSPQGRICKGGVLAEDTAQKKLIRKMVKSSMEVGKVNPELGPGHYHPQLNIVKS